MLLLDSRRYAVLRRSEGIARNDEKKGGRESISPSSHIYSAEFTQPWTGEVRLGACLSKLLCVDAEFDYNQREVQPSNVDQ